MPQTGLSRGALWCVAVHLISSGWVCMPLPPAPVNACKSPRLMAKCLWRIAPVQSVVRLSFSHFFSRCPVSSRCVSLLPGCAISEAAAAGEGGQQGPMVDQHAADCGAAVPAGRVPHRHAAAVTCRARVVSAALQPGCRLLQGRAVVPGGQCSTVLTQQ